MPSHTYFCSVISRCAYCPSKSFDWPQSAGSTFWFKEVFVFRGRVLQVLLLMAAMLLLSPALFAQGGGNVAITGTVKDPSGAVVPNALVTVTQQGTTVQRSTRTNEAGQFNVPSLRPATYTVTVEASGFSKYGQTITLLADQIRSLEIGLQLGDTKQEVTVEGSSVAVNTVTPVLNQVIEQSRVIELPLNGRNAADLTLLVPGAVRANDAGVTQGDTKQVPGAEGIAVNGARPDQVSYNLDGGTNEDLMSNANNPFPFPDAVQEFSVQTNSFDAQYGSNMGAVVDVVTKSGTNNWHGDAFEFVRNRVFNARNYFAAAKDPLKRNQFGGTLGGPIHKNSSFIFVGYQGTLLRTVGNSGKAILPLPQNLNGDFSNYLTAGPTNPQGKAIQIIDPTTGKPFAGDVGIPVNPVAVAMSKFLPISQAGPDGRITFGTPNNQNFNEVVARFDQVVRGQDKLFGRFYLDRFVHTPPFDGKNLLTIGTGSTVQTQNYSLGYTWIVKPNLVNETVGTILRAASTRSQGGNVPQMTDFGANIFQLPKSQGGIRGFGVSGYFSPGNGSFTNGSFLRNTGNVRDQATWTIGAHTLSFGGEFERDQSNIRNTDLENASWNFTSDLSNLALANFVMGHMRSFSQTSGDNSDSRENVVGLYIQDKWKVSRRLALSLGLRWEPQVPMKEIFGRTEQFRPDAYAAGVHSTVIPSAPAGLFFVGDSYNGIGFPATGNTPDWNNFAPRVGIAFDPTGSGKTAIRAGGGVFYYSRLPGLFLNDAAIIQPFSLRIDLTEPSSPNNLIPLANPTASVPSFEAGFPQRFTLPTVPKGVKFTPPVAVFGLEPGAKWVTPTTYDWNVSVEHQLRIDTMFRASYVGTRGTHLRQDVDLNPRAIGVGTEASRPYQQFSDILENRNTGRNSYNGLQLDVEKRPGGGSTGIFRHMTLLANYTFSKAMEYNLASSGGITDVGSSNGSGIPFGDPRQAAFETGPEDFDHRHRFVASYVWELPHLTNFAAPVRWVLGGWEWSGIYTVTSGDPLTIVAGKDQSKTNLNHDRADFVGPANQFGEVASSNLRSGCRPGETCVPWLDTAWFALPAVGTFGTVGKGTFRGPLHWNVDTGVIRNFVPMSSHENIRVQFRGEFFNVFNHTQLNNPSVSVSDSNFGGIRGAGDPRIIQLGLKLFF